MSHNIKLSPVAVLLVVLTLASSPSAAAPVPVRLERAASGGGWQLLRDGKPYYIKGGGGDGSKELLAKLGGNSSRTWGVGDDTQAKLDEAQRLGLTVTLGIWLRHTSDGFSYHDARQVAEQYEIARQEIGRASCRGSA